MLARVLPVLRGLARSKLWVEEREDGLQEAALKILERLDRVDLAQSETSIKNYLETIGLCKIKDLAKRLTRQRAREPYLETEEDELAGTWIVLQYRWQYGNDFTRWDNMDNNII